MEDNEKLAQERANEAQPGDFAGETPDYMHEGVTADRDTNGTSASMVRFGDLSDVQYAENLDEVSVDSHSDEGPFHED